MIADTQTMRELRQWVCWRSEERNGRPTKIPYSPLTGKKASSTDPDTWASYSEAVAAYRERGFDGIGFTFTRDDPFCGLDLDHCLVPESGQLEAWAQEIVDELDSYTEISPSGTGVHILVRATLPDGRNRKGPVEMYGHGRYFTMSGRHLAGTPRTIENRQEQVLALRRRLLEESTGPQRKPPLPKIGNNGLSDEEILVKAMQAANGDKFSRLWSG